MCKHRYAACQDARGLEARPALAVALLRDGTCSVRCVHTADLYVASLYMALQLMSGTTGGEFGYAVYSTAERIVFAMLVVTGAAHAQYVHMCMCVCMCMRACACACVCMCSSVAALSSGDRWPRAQARYSGAR